MAVDSARSTAFGGDGCRSLVCFTKLPRAFSIVLIFSSVYSSENARDHEHPGEC
jgi:hypothetical protein